MLFIILLIPLLYCITKTNINKEIIFYGIAFYFIFHLYQKRRIEGLLGLDDITVDDITDAISDTVDSIAEGGEEVLCMTSHGIALESDTTNMAANMIPLYDATADCTVLRYNFDQKWLSENPDCRPYINSASSCSGCFFVDTEGADDEGTCRPNIIQYYNDIVTSCDDIDDEDECINHTEKDGEDNNVMNICEWVTINNENDQIDKCIYTLDPPNDYLEHLCEESMNPPDCSSLSQEECVSNQLCEYADDTCSLITIDSQTGNSTIMKNICETTDLSVDGQETDKTCSYKLSCSDEGEEHICLYDYLGVGTIDSEYDEESTNSPCYEGDNSVNQEEDPPIDCTSIEVQEECIGNCTWENDTCS